MKFHFFHIIPFLILVIVTNNAETLPPQLYWKSILPNSPMPKAITKLLPNTPMTKAVTNLLLAGVDLGDRKGYDDGNAAVVNTGELPNPIFYHHAASGANVNSKELPNPIFYHQAASEADVNSKELLNPIFYQHAASEAKVNPGELPNPIFYHHVASEANVNSEELPNPIFYHHAAGETKVNPGELPNPIFYHHAASEANVNSKELPNPIFYHHVASEVDVHSKELPNPIFYHHVASEANRNSKELPNPIFYHHAASETNVNSKELPNPIFYHHAANEADVNSKELPNPIFYHHVASEADVNSKELPNPIFYHHPATEANGNSKESPNPKFYHHVASEADVDSKELPNPIFYHHVASEANVKSERLLTYNHVASVTHFHTKPSATIFFFEKDLHHGTKSNLKFAQATSKNDAKFFPRDVANSIPFSSNKVEYILNKLDINKGSMGARIVKKTISECEEEGIKGEEKLCVTSMESMIDFITSKFGKNVEALSTEGNKESEFQQYKIIPQGVKKMGEKNEVVVCHKVNYPYAVFYCHKINATKVYSAPLEGADGSRVKAIVVCHTDTSKWNPKHWAFQVLKVKPGSVPVCHLLHPDNVVWTSK